MLNVYLLNFLSYLRFMKESKLNESIFVSKRTKYTAEENYEILKAYEDVSNAIDEYISFYNTKRLQKN